MMYEFRNGLFGVVVKFFKNIHVKKIFIDIMSI